MSERDSMPHGWEWLPCGVGIYLNCKRLKDKPIHPYRWGVRETAILVPYILYQGITVAPIVAGIAIAGKKLLENIFN